MNRNRPIRLVIADDHPVVRTGLRHLFETEAGFEVVADVADGASAVEAVVREAPDLVLMDLQMPGVDGVEAIQRISALPHPPPVLVLTTYDSDAQILAAIEAGATGYLLKDVERDTLFASVRSAVRGGSPLAPTVAARLVQHLGSGSSRAPEPLTGRELEVVRLVARGASNREIARDLHLSEATVKTHLIHVFEKLGVADRTSAVTTALERGLIQLPHG